MALLVASDKSIHQMAYVLLEATLSLCEKDMFPVMVKTGLEVEFSL